MRVASTFNLSGHLRSPFGTQTSNSMIWRGAGEQWARMNADQIAAKQLAVSGSFRAGA